MYNYKFIFRSILVITFVLLIISPGCTFSTKANYRDFGKQGFNELKEFNEEGPISVSGELGKTTAHQYIAAIYIFEERMSSANELFDRMESYAITKDEKELAKSLVNYTYNARMSFQTTREIIELANRYNLWDIYAANPNYVSPDTEKKVTEGNKYRDLADSELKKAKILLNRMPEYQEDFAYLYELGTGQEQKDKPSSTQETNANIISDNIYIYLIYAFIFFIFIIIPSGIAYYLVRKKSNRSERFLNSILVGPGLTITIAWAMLMIWGNYPLPFILISIPFLLLGILCLMAYGLYYKGLTFKLKKKNKSKVGANNKKLKINPDKQYNSLEYLKNFDKLTEKEIVAFLYLKNNQDISKDKLNEMFGDETISSLIAKGHFREENINQN